jgi:hypothetical protein
MDSSSERLSDSGTRIEGALEQPPKHLRVRTPRNRVHMLLQDECVACTHGVMASVGGEKRSAACTV